MLIALIFTASRYLLAGRDRVLVPMRVLHILVPMLAGFFGHISCIIISWQLRTRPECYVVWLSAEAYMVWRLYLSPHIFRAGAERPSTSLVDSAQIELRIPSA